VAEKKTTEGRENSRRAMRGLFTPKARNDHLGIFAPVKRDRRSDARHGASRVTPPPPDDVTHEEETP
jgi:hypothetical protein